MGFNVEYENACKREAKRLEIAEKWAKVNLSASAKQFNQGRSDRLNGQPCKSANGDYLNGWYSI